MAILPMVLHTYFAKLQTTASLKKFRKPSAASVIDARWHCLGESAAPCGFAQKSGLRAARLQKSARSGAGVPPRRSLLLVALDLLGIAPEATAARASTCRRLTQAARPTKVVPHLASLASGFVDALMIDRHTCRVEHGFQLIPIFKAFACSRIGRPRRLRLRNRAMVGARTGSHQQPSGGTDSMDDRLARHTEHVSYRSASASSQ